MQWQGYTGINKIMLEFEAVYKGDATEIKKLFIMDYYGVYYGLLHTLRTFIMDVYGILRKTLKIFITEY